MHFIQFAIIAVILAGCSLIPKEKSKVDSMDTAQKINATNEVIAKRTVEGQKDGPLPNATINGNSNTLQILTGSPARESQKIPYREVTEYSNRTSQKSELSDKSDSASSSTIPFGVKLGLAGVGLAILAGAIWMIIKTLKNNSAAARAAIDGADQFLAGAIDRAKDAATKAMDPALALHHQTEAAALEKARGKVNTLL